MPPPQEVLAEKHRKAALEILEFTKPPEKRKITFSIVARCVDGGKKVPLSLSLDDNITTILERIQDEFELQQAPSVRVEWSSVIGAKQTSELTEQNVEETLGLLWKSRSFRSSFYPLPQRHTM